MISGSDTANVNLSREIYLKHLNSFLTAEALSKFMCIQPVKKNHSTGESQKN